jgi:hypothetical protein
MPMMLRLRAWLRLLQNCAKRELAFRQPGCQE